MSKSQKLYCIIEPKILKQAKITARTFPTTITNSTIEHNGKYYINAEALSNLFYSGLFINEETYEEYKEAVEENDQSRIQMILQMVLQRYIIHCGIEKLIAEKEAEKLCIDTN